MAMRCPVRDLIPDRTIIGPPHRESVDISILSAGERPSRLDSPDQAAWTSELQTDQTDYVFLKSTLEPNLIC